MNESRTSQANSADLMMMLEKILEIAEVGFASGFADFEVESSKNRLRSTVVAEPPRASGSDSSQPNSAQFACCKRVATAIHSTHEELDSVEQPHHLERRWDMPKYVSHGFNLDLEARPR